MDETEVRRVANRTHQQPAPEQGIYTDAAPVRPFLLFDPRAASQEAGELLIPGWIASRASNYDEVVRLSATPELRVGLALFPDDGDNRADMIASVARATCRMLWIALVPAVVAARSSSKAMRAIAESFHDFHTLPADPKRLSVDLGHAYGMSRLLGGLVAPEQSSAAEQHMVGASEVMQRLFQLIRRVAGVDAPVFIAGESGTGKELTARAMHERSRRAKGPFVTVDCGSLPATLIQSELFGYEKGAFTGATQRKVGKIEAASGGTIFLDEIGDLPLDLQGNLLRFLQESAIQRVGGTEWIRVDVRIIAASHVDLEKAVARGAFREDLYFRLCVLNLKMPPLRERGADVQLLAQFFFNRFVAESKRSIRGISPRALDAMLHHVWPGNVRELINRVRRAIVMCEGALITPADLGLDRRNRQRLAGIPSLEAARTEAEQEALRLALKLCGHNMSEVARALAVSRVTLYRLLRRHKHSVAERSNSQGTKRPH